MNGQLMVEQETQYLKLTLEGEFNFPMVKEALELARESCQKNSIRRVLFEYPSLSEAVAIADLLQIAEYGLSMLPPYLKSALVVPEERILPDHFLENVVSNRGMNFRVFSDQTECLAWLLK